MDINQDRAYDLDLQSLLPPTPGAQGSVPAAHIDGWLGHVEPGGLRHDVIAVLGTRTSTVRHQRLHGGTVFDRFGPNGKGPSANQQYVTRSTWLRDLSAADLRARSHMGL